jgi:hypothetical protein
MNSFKGRWIEGLKDRITAQQEKRSKALKRSVSVGKMEETVENGERM